MARRLVLAALALASVAGTAAAADPYAVRAAWVDPARAALRVDAIARAEARSLLREMDLSLSWRVGDAKEIAFPGDEVSVILVDRGIERASGVHVLGATPPRFEGARCLWVHVPSVRAAAGLREGASSRADALSARAFGVALGRVVAHELVHALAPSVPHGTGLMSAKLTCRHLTAARLAVDPRVGPAVRAILRGEPSVPPADTVTLAVTTAADER